MPLLGYLVELFFIISGFFAARTVVGTSKTKKSFFKYYRKKFLRLYPYALITVVVTAIIMMLHYFLFGCGVWGNSYSIAGIVTSFFMVNQGWIIEFAPALNNPIWYICVLLWLFILVYIIELLIEKIGRGGTRLRIFFYLSISFFGGLGWHFSIDLPFLHLSDFRGYATFFMGIFLYILWQESLNKIHYKTAVTVLSTLLLTAGIFIFVVMLKFNWYVWCYMILPGLIMLSVSLPQIKLKHTGMLSEITFQLYLWHVICFYMFQFMLDLNGINFTHGVTSMLLMTIVCFFVSWIVYKLVDVPLTEYLKKKGI